MSFSQLLVDDTCANLSAEAMSELERKRLLKGPSSLDDLVLELVGIDRSLDAKSAQVLAQAAVESLEEKGDITIQDAQISLGHTQAAV